MSICNGKSIHTACVTSFHSDFTNSINNFLTTNKLRQITYCDFPVTSTVNHNNIITFTISKNFNSNIFRTNSILIICIFPYLIYIDTGIFRCERVNNFKYTFTEYNFNRVTSRYTGLINSVNNSFTIFINW